MLRLKQADIDSTYFEYSLHLHFYVHLVVISLAGAVITDEGNVLAYAGGSCNVTTPLLART